MSVTPTITNAAQFSTICDYAFADMFISNLKNVFDYQATVIPKYLIIEKIHNKDTKK